MVAAAPFEQRRALGQIPASSRGRECRAQMGGLLSSVRIMPPSIVDMWCGEKKENVFTSPKVRSSCLRARRPSIAIVLEQVEPVPVA